MAQRQLILSIIRIEQKVIMLKAAEKDGRDNDLGPVEESEIMVVKPGLSLVETYRVSQSLCYNFHGRYFSHILRDRKILQTTHSAHHRNFFDI